MKPGKRSFTSVVDFSNTSIGFETISTLAMAFTAVILACKTIMTFTFFDYIFLLSMGACYYSMKEDFHVVPQHQVPANLPIKNGKKKPLNKESISLENNGVHKEEDSSETVPKQMEQSPEMLVMETKSSESEYTSGNHDLFKYFENEDPATRKKKVDLASTLITYEVPEEKAIYAALVCHDLEAALEFLMQQCDSCGKCFSLPEIVPMSRCKHQFCKNCAANHFAEVIKEGNILKCTCKTCELPKLESVEEAMEYLSSLDKYLESILSKQLCQKFKQELKSLKLRTKLKSTESMVSTRQENNGGYQLVTIKSRGNSSYQSTGVMTRSAAARASQNGSTANTTLTEFVSDRNYFFTGSAISALSNPNLLTTKTGPTETTADNNTSWPQARKGINKNYIDESRVENFYSNNNSTRENCSFCFVECYLPNKMISCEHKLCVDCICSSFSQIICEKGIIDCVCPVCQEPKLQSKEEYFKYFESFRKSFKALLKLEVQLLFEKKFKDYFGDDTCTKSYVIAKVNGQDDSNQLQRNCGHKKIPGSQVTSVRLLCEHSRCVDCIKEAIWSANILELVCDICYRDNREAQLKVLNGDLGINTRLTEAVGPSIYKIFKSCLGIKLAEKESASKFSLASSSRNSVDDYVEKRKTACPRCGVLCDLNRKPHALIVCGTCRTTFCETCKSWFNNGCVKNCYFKTGPHIHHRDVCFSKKKKIGFEKLESILKNNKVDFVKVKSKSGACLLREKFDCKEKPFKSELCKYHYEDYLANLILQNDLEKTSRWY